MSASLHQTPDSVPVQPRVEGHLPNCDLLVTRHDGLLHFLVTRGYVSENIDRRFHVSAADVVGKRVLGNLPLQLASLAETVTEVVLNLSPEDRLLDLTSEQVADRFQGFQTYRITQVTP